MVQPSRDAQSRASAPSRRTTADDPRSRSAADPRQRSGEQVPQHAPQRRPFPEPVHDRRTGRPVQRGGRSAAHVAPARPAPGAAGPAGPPRQRGGDLPTQLTPEVPSHRRPARRFQVIGAFVLVLGAVGGSYSVLRPPAPAPVSAEVSAPGLLTDDTVAAEMALARQRAQAKADAAAAAAAEKARQANEIAAAEAAASQQAAQTPDVPSSCDQYSGNRALGCALLLQAGFGLDQMGCLDAMWTKESNWNPNAHNASSGAHGIAQALPADKMAPYGADYLTNPVPQIRWGLDYIKGRYGTPCDAWAFWQGHNYY